LELPIAELIKHGLNNVGIFHSKKVIFADSYGNLNSEDLKLLYFYHNRLLGYKLEQYI
jgi:glycerol-3-phosphate O-acyltransferase